MELGNEVRLCVDWEITHADRLDPLVEGPPSILDQKPSWW